MFRCEGRGGAHDIPPEADVRCALGRQQMSTDRILDIEAPEQEFVGLHVGVGIALAHRRAVIRLREEARGAQHDAGKAEAAVEQLAEILRRRSEEHTSELQSLMRNSYAVFCLK